MSKIWDKIAKAQMTATKDRQLGIEFFRIISMMMICTLHIIGRGDALHASQPVWNYRLGRFCKIASYGAVNNYALISGYVHALTSVNYSNVVKLWLQVFYHSTTIVAFYQFVPSFIMKYISSHKYSITRKHWKLACTPILSNLYWYFTAYLGCFIVHPIFNRIHSMKQKEAVLMSVLFVVWFSMVPTYLGKDLFHILYGYSTIWILLLGILGAALSTFPKLQKPQKILCSLIYFVSVVLTWLSNIKVIPFLWFARTGYLAPTTVIGSIALFLMFRDLQIPRMLERLIRYFSPLTFGVYLVHMHFLFKQLSFGFFSKGFTGIGFFSYSWRIVRNVVSLYLMCSVVDSLRLLVFRFLHVKECLLFLKTHLSIVQENPTNRVMTDTVSTSQS